MYRILFTMLICATSSLHAQDIVTRGGFLTDSIMVGEPVQFYLTSKYKSNLDVLFPDSLFNFSPFEFEGKQYIPTRTDSVYSYDSAVYTLSTFEVDSVQYLRLPVFQIRVNDSIAHYTERDSVLLKHVVEELPRRDTVELDKLPLKEDPSYLPLSLQFNYPYLIIGLILLAVTLFVVFILFGKKIKRWWSLRQMAKRHENFKENFERLYHDDKLNLIEKARGTELIWKGYMEKLTDRPYTKLTTKEINSIEKDQDLNQALRNLDRVLYSNFTEEAPDTKIYSILRDHSEKIYHQRVEEVKND